MNETTINELARDGNREVILLKEFKKIQVWFELRPNYQEDYQRVKPTMLDGKSVMPGIALDCYNPSFGPVWLVMNDKIFRKSINNPKLRDMSKKSPHGIDKQQYPYMLIEIEYLRPVEYRIRIRDKVKTKEEFEVIRKAIDAKRL